MSTNTRPLPIFSEDPDLRPGPVQVACTACGGGTVGGGATVAEAYVDFDEHMGVMHSAHSITETWQVLELLGHRWVGANDAEGEHVIQWVRDHCADIDPPVTPKQYAIMLEAAAMALAVYANEFAREAHQLVAEMPLDPTFERVGTP